MIKIENYKKMLSVVKEKGFGTYIVTNEDGTTEKVRLFISKCDDLCKFQGKSRTRGYNVMYMDNLNWVSVKKVEKTNEQIAKTFTKRLNKCKSYLLESGLWQDFINDIDYLLESEDRINEFIKNDIDGFYDNVYTNKKYSFKFPELLDSLLSKGLYKIPYDKYIADEQRNKVKTAIDNKSEHGERWYGNYDYSITLTNDKNVHRGWFSAEFKGCGNGHYYLLINENYALFYEND